MISKLHIQGFQSWLDGTFEFAPGLNVIYGNTDSGKSAVIRALKFAIRNQLPRIPDDEEKRDNYINWSYKPKQSAIVRVDFEEGTWISREKSPNGKINLYNTSESDEPLKALKKFPREIEEITLMDDSNFQSQDELYFLLKETPGAVAKEFNRLSSLEVADILLTDTKSDLTKTNATITSCDESIEEIEEELKQFSKLDMAQKELSSLIKKENEIEELELDKEETQSLINDIITVQTDLEAFQDVQKALSELRDIEKEENELKALEKRLQNTVRLTEKLFIARSFLNKCKTLPTAKKELKTLLKRFEEIEENKRKVGDIEDFSEDLKEIHEELKTSSKEVAKWKKEKKEREKKLGICPLCGKQF